MSRINAALICSIGNVRGNNEDNYLFFGDYLMQREINSGAHIVHQTEGKPALLCIFDGMGGGDYGEHASSMAAELVAKHADSILQDRSGDILRKVLNEVGQIVADEARRLGAGTMGTTAAVLALLEDRALVANVGDSRIYLERGGRMELISTDHSIVYEQVLEGKLTMEEARVHPRSNAITRYIGMQNWKGGDIVTMKSVNLHDKDRWMICSDGVSDLLRHDQIQDIMKKRKSPDETAKELALMALELGGKDNTTCIVADVEQ